ncbi:MAG: hypothetical protein LBQ38_05430 [Spirochaetaceae bacterium]|nr:hypothetical protein [Spirochaetaceae bacterium]
MVIRPFVDSTLPFSGTAIQKIEFSDGENTRTLTIPGLAGHSVFLVKVNRSASTVGLYNTGHVYTKTEEAERAFSLSGPLPAVLPEPDAAARPVSGVFLAGEETITRYDHDKAQEFNNNPPPRSGTNASRALPPVLSQAVPGDSREFWVEKTSGASKPEDWTQITAVLRAQGNRGNIWIPEEYFIQSGNGRNPRDNKLSSEQAKLMAEKFDAIYAYTTPIFGYEYGGGVPETDETYGGIDGDPRIQILIYDIDFDQSSAQISGTFGYFWAKDHYGNSASHSNASEIIYMDSYFMDAYTDAIYSTLAHELQHMIQFNEKDIKKGLPGTETWYNEMLSMLAEDMIAPLIGVSAGNDQHPIKNRIPLFLGYYNYAGITEWRDGNYALISYADVYAFGAYLARNYGGAELIREIAGNDTADVSSVSQALGKLNPGMTEGYEFEEALSRYGEVFVYSGNRLIDGVFSFDRRDTKTINGIDYTFYEFDIWKMNYTDGGYNVLSSTGYKGPLVWDLRWAFEMRRSSLILQSLKEWQGITGDLVIEAEKPKSDYVDLYLMIR